MRKGQHSPSCFKSAHALHSRKTITNHPAPLHSFYKSWVLIPTQGSSLFTCQSLSSSCFKGKHVKETLWPVIYLPLLPSFCRSHIASLIFLEHTWFSPTLRPWHWLFPLPGMYFPRCLHSQFPYILQVLLCHSFNEAYPDHCCFKW